MLLPVYLLEIVAVYLNLKIMTVFSVSNSSIFIYLIEIFLLLIRSETATFLIT